MAKNTQSVTFHDDGSVRYERWLVGERGERRLAEGKTVEATALLPELEMRALLPPSCRFLIRNDQRAVYVCEEVPCIRTVRWNTSNYFDMRERLFGAMGTMRHFVRDELLGDLRHNWREIRNEFIAWHPHLTGAFARARTRCVRMIHTHLPTLAEAVRSMRWLCWQFGVVLPFSLTLGLILRLCYAITQRMRTTHARAFNPAQMDFQLAFPYVVYISVITNDRLGQLYVYFRNEPLRSRDDALGLSNLPNQRAGDVCMPKDIARPSPDHAVLIAQAQRAFWGSTWNSDLTQYFLHYAARHAELASPWEWETASREDPTFMCRIPWEPYATVVRLCGEDESIAHQLIARALHAAAQ